MESLKLHDTISFYRKKQNMTQEALAQKLGVTNQSVSKWESAQCYPDISLIPKLAAIFGISIDELFGKQPATSGLNDIFSLRDDIFRVVVARGGKVIDAKELSETIHIEYPQHASGDRQCYKVEVFGSISCQGNICGDVESQGAIQCNIISGDVACRGNVVCKQLNGDATTFGGTLSCKGDITGDVKCQGDLSCVGSIVGDVECRGTLSCANTIEGNVNCGNEISCAGSIGGSVNCGDNVTCIGKITGDVTCGGSIECTTIEGNVECQGNIIYK